MNLSNFPERLSELIFESGTNAAKLSLELGYGNATISRYLTGRSLPTVEAAVRLADYFQCSLDFLAGRSETVLDYLVREMPPFYDSLRAVMKEKGVTRYRLVKDLPIYDGYFTNWKKGKSPNILTLILLADYLDVTIDYMVGRER